MSWTEFYTGSHVGDPFGRTSSSDAFHNGADYKGWPPGTKIPSPCDGVVTASAYSIFYGWYVTWLCVHGKRCGRAHMLEKGLSKGADVHRGKSVGRVGSSGRYAQGPHCHAYEGTTDSPALGDRRDPAPHIRAQFGTAPAETGKPITLETDVDNMKFLSHATAKVWYLIGEFSVTRTRQIETARQWKQSHGTSLTCDGEAIKSLILVAANNTATRDAQTKASVKSALTGTVVAPTVDYAAIAKAVEKQLADEFAAAPKLTVDELKNRI